MTAAHSGRRKGRDLQAELKARILDGTYPAGACLPSTRSLAAERGLARSTVSTVYEQLAAEGFIDSRSGAASRVAQGAAPLAGGGLEAGAGGASRVDGEVRLSALGERVRQLQPPRVSTPAVVPEDPAVVDFVYGPLAGRDFPTSAWERAVRQAGRERPERLAYGDPRGDPGLRAALQSHLSRTRGLACHPDQLMIVNGSQQALDLCARLLVDPGDTVAVENPGYRMAHQVFEAAGAHLAGVEVDAQGLRTDRLPCGEGARLACVTPTHQFPLGSFLSVPRRHALLAWAQRQGAWIVEDDYDSEYRHALRADATLHTLDAHQSVIYVGTFSKTLSPQLRLGYMVLPRALADVFAAARRLGDRHAPFGTQRALAAMMESGSYDRHVRRIRRLQDARRTALLESIGQYFGDRAVVEGASGGLHVVVRLPGVSCSLEPDLAARALRHGVRIYPLGPFHLPSQADVPDRPAGFVMGYALLEPAQVQEGVRRLAAAFPGV
ncbi:PLP-dependent aminotransferase family protein [Paracidovorax cattleyae]|uniref:Transcriptional regulator, GntR family n=1 Tax=Paracidovorax cattleyae TaxID=80868 RepID=A0A1H0MY37_9BURK|nr:PLP-dependent aminotransferase family protein [Paracidovorax cattleyae]AVS75677.1 PLP-dependent aminotransferase family protein [Paracidovorax cattleyae]SDO85282.1 transcriptional regulator, GntR family [Paracidovorax cattleyae]